MQKLHFSRKSQGAMEFLLSYGWAMLIVLVAISALAYYGVLDPTVLLPDKCTLQKGPLECTDQKIYIFSSANGQFHLKLANIFDNTVEVKSLRILREDFQCSYSGVKTIAGGTEGCIPLFCKNIPGTRKKRGFELEIKYSMPGGFEKILAGELYTAMRKPTGIIKGCPMESGDGNGDGKIDEKDTKFIAQYILSNSSDEVFDYSAYDLDNDGAVTGADMGMLNNVINLCNCCDEASKLDVMRQYEEDNDINIRSICGAKCLFAYGPEQQCLELDNHDINNDGAVDGGDVALLDDIMLKCRCCTRVGNLEDPKNIIEAYQQNPLTYDYASECTSRCGGAPGSCPPLI